MLKIKDLTATVDGTPILKGVNLKSKQAKFMLLWDPMEQENPLLLKS